MTRQRPLQRFGRVTPRAARRLGNGRRQRAPKADDDDDFYLDDERDLVEPVRRTIDTVEQDARAPEFTGLVDSSGNPIFRFYAEKNAVGFCRNADEADPEWDPDSYWYGLAADGFEQEEEEDQ